MSQKRKDGWDKIATKINADCRIHGIISIPALLMLIAAALRRVDRKAWLRGYSEGCKDGKARVGGR